MRIRPDRAAAFAAVTLLSACASLSTPSGGLMNNKLKGCPSAPHCVSSMATDEHHTIAPFQLADGPQEWDRLMDVVSKAERTKVVSNEGGYVRAEVVSPWRFYTDDLELLRANDGRIDVRSSSRIGYYDFGVNRKRVEALRASLQDAGVILRERKQ